MRLKNLLIVLAAIMTVTACTPATESSPEKEIVISEATVRKPMGGRDMTAGYFQITNHTNLDDAIMGVESPIAERVEIHISETVNNAMMMRKMDLVDLKAGETIVFKPGSYHLMLFGVELNRDQVDVALTLKFKHARDMTIIAELADTVSINH